jgi:hypothetical protein
MNGNLAVFPVYTGMVARWQVSLLSLRKTPSRGGRQQPHQTLKKFKKYKGGKKHHTMVAQSAPKMPK